MVEFSIYLNKHVFIMISTSQFFQMMYLKSPELVGISVDPDQKPHSVTPDLGILCFLRPICPNTLGQLKYIHILLILMDFVALIENLNDSERTSKIYSSTFITCQQPYHNFCLLPTNITLHKIYYYFFLLDNRFMDP